MVAVHAALAESAVVCLAAVKLGALTVVSVLVKMLDELAVPDLAERVVADAAGAAGAAGDVGVVEEMCDAESVGIEEAL
jgi:hypothetical protein